jgi:sulfoxide reductase catalytic subunit YedY
MFVIRASSFELLSTLGISSFDIELFRVSKLSAYNPRMFIRKRKPWDLVGGQETPEPVAMNRRKWLRLAGAGVGAGALGVGAYAAWKGLQGSDEQVVGASTQAVDWEQRLAQYFPASLDPRFSYGRAETDRAEAARYTNFYEFSSFKWTWRYIDDFRPYPWQLSVGGLCHRPRTFQLDDLMREFSAELAERQYRHRCVERWAMAIPWTGIPLASLLQAAEPQATATHVRFVSFQRPEEAPHQRSDEYPWPYTEGLTLGEAMNELTLLATGMYGRPLLKQHGAPVRLVVPWKYGFKSIKSIERIEFTDDQPPTFWSTLNPEAYPFEANVEPDVPRPWPQNQERMLGTNEIFETQLYNGYGEYVAELYARK